jgi:hypothetical protein
VYLPRRWSRHLRRRGVQLFIAWTQSRLAAGQTPLLALVVIESPQDRAA